MTSPTFTLNDESIKSSHDFYLLNSGCRRERFDKNPVMLDNHNLDRLVGKWNNLRVEGTALLAEPEFDEGTELGRERKGQVERGYLKGGSPGLYIRGAEYRFDPETETNDLYITDWELVEGSITPLPSNAGAVTLRIYDSESRPVADADVRGHLENIVKLTLNQKQTNTIMSTNNASEGTKGTVTLTAAALVALNVAEGADPAAISAAIVKLSSDYAKEKKEHEALKEKVEAQEKERAEALVNLAVQEGKIGADKKDAFLKLAAENYNTVKEMLEGIPAKVSLSAQVKGVAGASSVPVERQKWNLHMWMKEDMVGLQKLKAEEPEAYAEIAKRI